MPSWTVCVASGYLRAMSLRVDAVTELNAKHFTFSDFLA